jgi:hypothetical protein
MIAMRVPVACSVSALMPAYKFFRSVIYST